MRVSSVRRGRIRAGEATRRSDRCEGAVQRDLPRIEGGPRGTGLILLFPVVVVVVMVAAVVVVILLLLGLEPGSGSGEREVEAAVMFHGRCHRGNSELRRSPVL